MTGGKGWCAMVLQPPSKGVAPLRQCTPPASVLVLVLMLTVGSALLPIVGGAEPVPGGRAAPLELGQSGWWNITTPQTYISQTLRSLGNITIPDGGVLTLENATLLMGLEHSMITVESGGRLSLLMGATIDGAANTSSNVSGTTYRYCLIVEEGAHLMVKHGSILGTGWSNGTATEGG